MEKCQKPKLELIDYGAVPVLYIKLNGTHVKIAELLNINEKSSRRILEK